jgi:hypothetical protein
MLRAATTPIHPGRSPSSAAAGHEKIAGVRFHFVEDYRLFVQRLMRDYPLDTAMRLAVGGDYRAFGHLQRER